MPILKSSFIMLTFGFKLKTILFFQLLIIRQQIIFRTTFPQGVNMRMLTKQQIIFGSLPFNFIFQVFLKKLFLVIPGLPVINSAKIFDYDFLLNKVHLEEVIGLIVFDCCSIAALFMAELKSNFQIKSRSEKCYSRH